MLSDGGAGGHQTDSLPGCLGFDLRYDDISAGEILGLTPTLSCMWENKAGLYIQSTERHDNMQKPVVSNFSFFRFEDQ